MSLRGKNAIVTGGSRGIGAGIARELAKRGANALITYASSSSKADEVVQAIKSQSNPGNAVAVQADCMDAEAPQKVIAVSLKAFGDGVDIIVNNAGAGDELYLKDITLEHFDKVCYTNVRFPIFLVRTALPHL